MNSIDWLMQTLEQNNLIDLDVIDSNTYYTIIEQAKKMHKQEIIDAWIATDNELQRIAAEQYYQETFVSKGVREEALQFLTTQAQELDLGYETELPKEISDEEIEKEVNEYAKLNQILIDKFAWMDAIKWYREQLKSKPTS